MQIDWALPCRFAEAAPDGTATLVGAGIDSLWAAEVPAQVGVFLMLRVAGPPYEFEEAHTLAIRLIDPERDEQDVLQVAFGPMHERSPLMHPGLDAGILVPAAVGWNAEHYGLYTLDVFVDDRRQRSVPVLVRGSSELQP